MTPIQYNRFVVAQDHTHKTSGTNNWFTQAVEKFLLRLPYRHHNQSHGIFLKDLLFLVYFPWQTFTTMLHIAK